MPCKLLPHRLHPTLSYKITYTKSIPCSQIKALFPPPFSFPIFPPWNPPQSLSSNKKSLSVSTKKINSQNGLPPLRKKKISRSLNWKHNYFTDIITFDNSIEKGKIIGDIFISIDTVRINAKQYETTFDDELHRVMIHGLLHLTGYSDKSPMKQKEMRRMEDYWLKKLK